MPAPLSTAMLAGAAVYALASGPFWMITALVSIALLLEFVLFITAGSE